VPLTGMRSRKDLPMHLVFSTSDTLSPAAGTAALLIPIVREETFKLTRWCTMLASMRHSGRGRGAVGHTEGTMPEEAFVA